MRPQKLMSHISADVLHLTVHHLADDSCTRALWDNGNVRENDHPGRKRISYRITFTTRVIILFCVAVVLQSSMMHAWWHYIAHSIAHMMRFFAAPTRLPARIACGFYQTCTRWHVLLHRMRMLDGKHCRLQTQLFLYCRTLHYNMNFTCAFGLCSHYAGDMVDLIEESTASLWVNRPRFWHPFPQMSQGFVPPRRCRHCSCCSRGRQLDKKQHSENMLDWRMWFQWLQFHPNPSRSFVGLG